MRSWSSGRILACHAGGPGSIPGLRTLFRRDKVGHYSSQAVKVNNFFFPFSTEI
jgi:hypothetical protein